MRDLNLEYISEELTMFYKNCIQSLPNELREYADTDPELPTLTTLKQFGSAYEITDLTPEEELINCFKVDITNLIKYYIGNFDGVVSYSPTVSVFKNDTINSVGMVVRILC